MPRTRTTLAILFASTALVLSSCSSDDSDAGVPTSNETAASTDTSTTDAPDDADSADALTDLYNDALDGLGPEFFDADDFSAGEPTGEFEYALVDITADGKPELLVKAIGSEFGAVRVLAASEDDSELIEAQKIFHEGAASAGGARMALEASANNDALFETSGQSASGQTTTTAWEFDGAEMQESGQTWDYRSDQVPGDLEGVTVPIDWVSVDDRSGVDAIGAEGEGGSSGPQPTPSADAGDSGEGAEDASALADDPNQIGGDCGVLDGATVTAGDNTSCGFAMNVAQEALKPVYVFDASAAPDPTVTPPAGVATVEAYTPANSETLTMECMIGTAGDTSTCTGGNDAMVSVSRSGNGTLLNLVKD